jgi:flagellar hook assembly protein FlgD
MFDLTAQPPLTRPATFAIGGTTPAGNTFVSQKFTVSKQDPTAVDSPETTLPTTFGLLQNYPNPFNGETQIQFDISYPTHVQLAVFNVLGQKVRTLVDETLPVGRHSARWDGIDDFGRSSASGVYFCRISTGSFTGSRKMLFLK